MSIFDRICLSVLLICERRNISQLLVNGCYYAPTPTCRGALSDDARLTSVCLTSVAYIGPKSRTERHRKTKIGTEVANVARDSDTTFKVKKSKVKVKGGA